MFYAGHASIPVSQWTAAGQSSRRRCRPSVFLLSTNFAGLQAVGPQLEFSPTAPCRTSVSAADTILSVCRI